MRLAELQRAFQCRVLGHSPEIVAAIAGSESLSAESRLGVYEYAFTARLAEALTATYPAIQRYLGRADFDALVADFAVACPPTHFSIRYYGENLHAFVAKRFAKTRAAGLSELARWEWLLCAAFDAPDSPARSPSEMQGIPPEAWGSAQFRLSASLQRCRLTTNAVQWWQALCAEGPRPSRWRHTKATEWVLWRADLKTYFRSLTQDEAWALDAVAQGRSFGAVCEGLAQFGKKDNAPLRAATLLQRWFQDGWVTEVLVGNAQT